MQAKAAAKPALALTKAETSRKRGGRQAWARLQIRMTVEAMHLDGAPLADLTQGQIMARCCTFMREKRKLEKAEIPKPRSFERYLSGIVRSTILINGRSAISFLAAGDGRERRKARRGAQLCWGGEVRISRSREIDQTA